MTLRYVNTASSAGGDGTTNNTSGATRAYVGIAEFIVQEEASLSEQMICSCSGSTAETITTTGFLVDSGWTLNGNLLTFQGNPDTSDGAHDGVYSTSHFRVIKSISGTDFITRNNGLTGVEYTRFQMENTNAGAESSFIMRHTNGSGNTIDGMILRLTTNGAGIFLEDSGGTTDVRNTIVYSVNLGTASEGIHTNADFSGTLNIDNCIINNLDDGVESDGGTITVENSAVYNIFNDEFDGTITVNYCASNDGHAGTGNFEPTDFDDEFVDINGPNWNLESTSARCYDEGLDLSGTFTTDIEGTTRTLRASTAWSVGVFDEVPGGGGATNPKNPLGHPLRGCFGGPIG